MPATFHIKGYFAVAETVRDILSDIFDSLLGRLVAAAAFTWHIWQDDRD